MCDVLRYALYLFLVIGHCMMCVCLCLHSNQQQDAIMWQRESRPHICGRNVPDTKSSIHQTFDQIRYSARHRRVRVLFVCSRRHISSYVHTSLLFGNSHHNTLCIRTHITHQTRTHTSTSYITHTHTSHMHTYHTCNTQIHTHIIQWPMTKNKYNAYRRTSHIHKT